MWIRHPNVLKQQDELSTVDYRWIMVAKSQSAVAEGLGMLNIESGRSQRGAQ